MPSTQLQKAYYVTITNDSDFGYGTELMVIAYGPGFEGPSRGAGEHGIAWWQPSDSGDVIPTWSLVPNPNPELQPTNSPPQQGQVVSVQGVAAGASVTINLLTQGADVNEVTKIVMDGLSTGVTKTVGYPENTTPL
jgi:hypothetical protein